MNPKTVTAFRYVTPLREAGSLAVVVEEDDGEIKTVVQTSDVQSELCRDPGAALERLLANIAG